MTELKRIGHLAQTARSISIEMYRLSEESNIGPYVEAAVNLSHLEFADIIDHRSADKIMTAILLIDRYLAGEEMNQLQIDVCLKDALRVLYHLSQMKVMSKTVPYVVVKNKRAATQETAHVPKTPTLTLVVGKERAR